MHAYSGYSSTVMIFVRFDQEIFKELLRIWPDPHSGKQGVTQASLAKVTKISQGTISNYLKSDNGFRHPRSQELKKLGEFFKIITFADDWSGYINNERALSEIKQFLNTNVYRGSLK
ncbi:MAG: helix-turn-helix domain-containing protein [Candidatus Sericytochromatia bacterium]